MSSSGEQGNGLADNTNAPPSITADGSYVAFDSRARNLVPNDPDGSDRNVFLRGPLHN